MSSTSRAVAASGFRLDESASIRQDQAKSGAKVAFSKMHWSIYLWEFKNRLGTLVG